MKKFISLMIAAALFMSLMPSVLAEGVEYIPAPYTIEEGQTISDAYLEPVFYTNDNGPTIGVTTVGVLKVDGLYFKDSNNNQQLDVFEDWRLDAETRAADAVSKMTLVQQAGFVFNNLMLSPGKTKAEDVIDENGNVIIANVTPLNDVNVFVDAVVNQRLRCGIMRSNPDGTVAVLFNNFLNQTAEYGSVVNGEIVIPFVSYSNPISAGYPGSVGMAAAVMGDLANGGDYSMVYDYAVVDRIVWDAKGIDGMYGPQIDLVTDPRWSRNSGTYGEVPEVVAGIATALVTGYQEGTDGVKDGGVALMMKHFPGDGAAENGFESHNYIGQWRLYPTEGSLEKYQLVGFQAAVDAGIAGIMPGYSRPTTDGRSATQIVKGVEINAAAIGNAYNKDILDTLLRNVMGFKGFINTDSGIVNGQNFGAAEMSLPERLAMIISAGTDNIGDQFNAAELIEAVETGLLPKEDLDRANTNRIKVLFQMGQFENPYKDMDESLAALAGVQDGIAAAAHLANQKSVVLMKNHANALPLADTDKKVYVASYTAKGPNENTDASLKAAFEAAGFTVVGDYNEADIAFLAVAPSLNNSQQMSVIDLVDGLKVEARNYPASQEKTGEIIDCITVQDIGKIPALADAVHANGGVVIASITTGSPWILTNLEPYCDGLIAISGSSVAAQVDVLTGAYNPTGKLPITYVACNEVIAVNEQEIDGVVYEICVSPNDVPGYDKDQYIAAEVLAQSPSGSYAYQDADGNFYRAWFGLSY